MKIQGGHTPPLMGAHESNSSSRGKKNSCIMFKYRSEFTVTATSFSSKNQGLIIPAEEIAHHTVTLGECKGL